MAPALSAIKRVLGINLLLYRGSGGGSQTPTAVVGVYNEQVGFVDDNGRAVFTLKLSDLGAELDRTDWFVISGQTDRWYVVDVRDDKSGGVEVRCDRKLTRL